MVTQNTQTRDETRGYRPGSITRSNNISFNTLEVVMRDVVLEAKSVRFSLTETDRAQRDLEGTHTTASRETSGVRILDER